MNNKNIWFVQIPRLVLGLFIILQIIAMISYAGGTFFDAQNTGYSFTRNFLSDLGRTEGFSGDINFISSLLFNMSLLLAGSVLVMFYLNIRHIFVEYNYLGLSYLGSLFGVLSGIALVGVGLTPSDLYLPLHVLSAKWLFRFFFGASFCYSIIIYRTDIIEGKYAHAYLLFAISILTYIFISEMGPSPKESEFALTVQVFSQKIILLILVFVVYCQTVALEKLHH